MYLCVNRRIRVTLTKGLLFVVVMLIIYFLSCDLLDETLTVQGLLKFTEQNEQNVPKPFLVQPTVTCRQHSVKSTVIIVISKKSNYLQQETIRRTWGNHQMQLKYNFSLYFLIGTDEITDRNNGREKYSDIIQVDVKENYYHLTDKTMAAFNWVTNFCHEAQYFFKVDDDIYLDLETLREMRNNEDYLPDDVILGSCFHGASPHRIATKWKVSYEEYPFTTYPPYCTGSGYAMTLASARKISQEMRRTRTIKLEDVYVGIIAFRLGMSVKSGDYFVYDVNPYVLGYWLLHDFYIRCHKIIHYIRPEIVEQLWDNQDTIGRNQKDCSTWGKARHVLSYILYS